MNWTAIGSYLDKILNYVLFQVKQTPVTVLSVAVFVLFIAFFIVLAILSRRVLNRRIFKKLHIDEGTSHTLSRITQYVIITIGALVSLQFIGIDLSGLTVVFGLLSVGIGFGLQNITADFISGLIILFERPIRVGDRVMVNDINGDVTEINIRSTMVRTVNNVTIIIPNSAFVSKNVVNYSHGDPSYRLDIEVGVARESDLEVVINALQTVADENKGVLASPKAQVHLIGFGDSAWNMQLRVWVADVKYYPAVRNEPNQAIVRIFRNNDIKIPFPQRDLHMSSSVNVPVELKEMK